MLLAFRVAVRDQRLNFNRQVGFRAGAHLSILLSVNQPNIARRALSFGVGRAIRRTSRKLGSLPIDALSSFPTEAVFNQRWNARCTELDKPTRPLPALFLNWPEPNHLEHSAQNTTVIDHAIEHSVHQLSITNRQRNQQCGRHVLHERLLASVQSQLRQVLVVVDFVDQLQDLVELSLSRAVERVIERTRSGNLSQSVLRLKLVRAPPASLTALARGNRLVRLAKRDLLAIRVTSSI